METVKGERGVFASVIIPQFGRSELTIQAVASLQDHHRRVHHEIVIVDDGSDPRHLRVLQYHLSGTVLIVPVPRRGGVTRAWNVGARQARGRFLVFLNNDTLSTGPWLERLIAPLATGMSQLTGCRRRRERDLPGSLKRSLGPRNFLDGWCLGISQERLLDLGGFDERFKLYFSDTDLQCRILQRSAGPETLATVPGLPLLHLGHETTRTLLTKRQTWREDRRRFQEKWS